MQTATDASAIRARTLEIATAHDGLEAPLLPTLHGVQDALGHIPEEALLALAEHFNLSRAEVHGVMSFYHDFKTKPGGRKVLKICRAEACQAMGADAVAAAVKDKLGVDWHETTPNSAVTLEPVYCLGLCACAPAAMLDDKVHGRVNEQLDTLLAEAQS